MITPKGRNLLHIIQYSNLNYLPTGEPTYWSADLNKLPDLLDFAIANGISSTGGAIKISHIFKRYKKNERNYLEKKN